MPRTSNSCLNAFRCVSIVSRVVLLTFTAPNRSSREGEANVCVACSNRVLRTLVRISPKTTVAIFPSTCTIVPTVVSPIMRTSSPTAKVSALFLVAATCLLACSSFCFCASRSFFRFSLRSLRCFICATFLAKSSSLITPLLAFVVSCCNPLSKVFSSWRIFLVASFSACCSLISRMAFSMRLLLSCNNSSACCLARLTINFRSCSKSLMSCSYRAVFLSNSFSSSRTVWRLFSQYRLSRTISCRYLSLWM